MSFFLAIIIESSSCFFAKIASIDIIDKERARSVFRVSKVLVEDLHDGEASIKSDEVCKCEGT
jgi:hypothetical protein